MKTGDKVQFNANSVGTGAVSSRATLVHGRVYTVGEIDDANKSVRLQEDVSGKWHSKSVLISLAYEPLRVGQDVIYNQSIIPTGVSGCILPVTHAVLECINGGKYTIAEVHASGSVRLKENGSRFYNPEQFVAINRLASVAKKYHVGYKAKPEFKQAAYKLSPYPQGKDIDFDVDSLHAKTFSSLGVLDLWFNPVFIDKKPAGRFLSKHKVEVTIGDQILFGKDEIPVQHLYALVEAITVKSSPGMIGNLPIVDIQTQVQLGPHKLTFSELFAALRLHKDFHAGV